ncbi:MAG TPA: hypothetical protein VHX38_25355 [Pseudonocardiaceae bacterium]|nr:hypothetical protein [Pseudonocardiaceae bacterium]
MTDPNTPSGSNPFYVSNNGTYGDPGSVSGDPNDYESWTWKQIEASILGSSAVVPGTSGPTTNDAVANPDSLYKAGQVFFDVQAGLKMISQSISDQAMALAGPNGPWQGTSATSFLDMMTNLSNSVNAKANQINGGSGDMNPVPQQLWNNGNYLQWAQNTIQEIDSWYATQAIALGHQEPNGLAQISDLPNFVTAMTDDMRTVIRNLAGNYSLAINSVVVPTPIQSTPPDPNLPPPPNSGGDNSNNPPPPPDTGGDNSNLPPPPDTGGNNSNLPPPPDTSGNNGGLNNNDLTAVPPPAPVSLNGPGGDNGGVNGQDLSAVPPPSPASLSGPGGTDGGLNNNDLSAVPPPSPLSLSGPGGTDGGLNPTGGTDGGLNPQDLSAVPPPLSLSGPGGTDGGVNGQDLSAVPPPAPLSLSGPAGSEGGLNAQDLSAVPPPLSLSGPAGSTSNLKAGGPSGSGGGLGGQNLAAAPTPDPLSLSGPGGSGLNANGTSNPGGAGMPMMPGMGGGGGAPNSSGDQSDASGLLGGVTEPWAGPVLTGLGGPTGGVRPGSVGGLGSDLAAAPKPDPLALSGPGGGGLNNLGTGGDPGADGLSHSDLSVSSPDTVPGEVSPSLAEPQAVGGSGMPMMPGMGGGGGVPNGSGDQSDASGLLGGESDPWVGPAPSGVGDPTGGVAPGVLNPPSQEIPSGNSNPWETLGVEAALVELPLAAGLLLSGKSDPTPDKENRRHHPAEAVSGAMEPAVPGTPEPDPGTTEPAHDHVSLEDEVTPTVGRVAVVRPPDGTENRAAWDSASAPFLMSFLPVGRPGGTESEETTERNSPAAELDDEVSMPSEYSTFRKKPRAEGKPTVGAFVPMCGGNEAPDEEPEDESDDDSDDEGETGERSMADLLSQDFNVWGSTAKASNGVLE